MRLYTRTSALRERLGQPAALEARQVLADAVHLVDGRAAGVQQGGDALLVFQRHALDRRRQQGGAAAGQQAQAEVVRPHRLYQIQHLPNAGDAGRRRVVDAVGPAGVEAHGPQRPHRPLRHVDHAGNAVEPVGQRRLDAGRHRRPGLAAADHEDAAGAIDRPAQVGAGQGGADQPHWVGGGDGGVPDGAGVFARGDGASGMRSSSVHGLRPAGGYNRQRLPLW